MLKKVKILVSLIMVMLVVWTVCSDSSFATDITTNTAANNTLVITTITASPVNNTANTSNTANNTTNTNVATISGTVNTAKNVTNTNSSRYETTNSTKLPYAGSNTSIIFVVLAFVASAVYAYKKVSEYNV